MTLWYTNTFHSESSGSCQSVSLFTKVFLWSLDDWASIWLTRAFHHQSHIASVAENRHGLNSSKVLGNATYSQEVCISWKFPWDHPLEQRDPVTKNNHTLCVLVVNNTVFFITSEDEHDILRCCCSQWSTWVEGAASLGQQQLGGLGKLRQGQDVNLEL